jgi:hypothetical protein
MPGAGMRCFVKIPPDSEFLMETASMVFALATFVEFSQCKKAFKSKFSKFPYKIFRFLTFV